MTIDQESTEASAKKAPSASLGLGHTKKNQFLASVSAEKAHLGLGQYPALGR